MLLNLVTEKIGQLLESEKVEKVGNSQECEEMGEMTMQNSEEAESRHNRWVLAPN